MLLILSSPPLPLLQEQILHTAGKQTTGSATNKFAGYNIVCYKTQLIFILTVLLTTRYIFTMQSFCIIMVSVGRVCRCAITDDGFSNYLTLPTFDSVRNNGQILGTWDFVTNDNSVNEDDSHGMKCFSTIAANMPGTFVGTAPAAAYYLYRTEDIIFRISRRRTKLGCCSRKGR